ncbi:hypothetical protein NMY22_g14733 [Coprinellus aureogranulatus]|nr:hypothetical protein NMY22_g14733 [Coprinellus aureogranulatus]
MTSSGFSARTYCLQGHSLSSTARPVQLEPALPSHLHIDEESVRGTRFSPIPRNVSPIFTGSFLTHGRFALAVAAHSARNALDVMAGLRPG